MIARYPLLPLQGCSSWQRKSKLKNDRVDAKALGELLRTNYLPTSHIMIGPDVRERKLLAMERARYARRRAR